MSLDAARSPGIPYDPFKRNEPSIVATLQSLAMRHQQPREQVWLCTGTRRPYRIASAAHSFGEFDHLDEARDFLRLLLTGNPDLELLS